MYTSFSKTEQDRWAAHAARSGHFMQFSVQRDRVASVSTGCCNATPVRLYVRCSTCQGGAGLVYAAAGRALLQQLVDAFAVLLHLSLCVLFPVVQAVDVALPCSNAWLSLQCAAMCMNTLNPIDDPISWPLPIHTMSTSLLCVQVWAQVKRETWEIPAHRGQQATNHSPGYMLRGRTAPEKLSSARRPLLGVHPAACSTLASASDSRLARSGALSASSAARVTAPTPTQDPHRQQALHLRVLWSLFRRCNVAVGSRVHANLTKRL